MFRVAKIYSIKQLTKYFNEKFQNMCKKRQIADFKDFCPGLKTQKNAPKQAPAHRYT